MTSPTRTADLLARLKRVEEARRFVAKHDEWLASAPPLPLSDGAGQAEARTSQARDSHTTEELTPLVVELLENTAGALRARSILEALRERGVSFVSAHPLDKVVAALKFAQAEGWLVMKGRGWWQIAPPAVELGAHVDISDLDVRASLEVGETPSEDA